MKALFATAELAPLVKVGGLGDFSAGFASAMERLATEIEVILPDYGNLALADTSSPRRLEVPDWCAPAVARTATLDGVRLTLLRVSGIERPNPYVDADGRPWIDNDLRFIGFSAAVAAWATENRPDVLHLNDWHTGAVPAFLAEPVPTVLTIHNLAYQGNADLSWLERFPHDPEPYLVDGETNPLAGGIALANRVVAVSPNFVLETLPPNDGFGLAHHLAKRGSAYTGILNGIDTGVWDPRSDDHLDHTYDIESLAIKADVRSDLMSNLGLAEGAWPLVGMVTRLTEQKGVDLALATLDTLIDAGGSMVLLGAGERDLADAARSAASRHPGRFVFHEGYDEGLSHRIFAAADLYLMPSRFEPAGLAQMQAMRYGAIPVVTDVGGLHDTVVDADADPQQGNGFVSANVSVPDLIDALARAIVAWRDPDRRHRLIERGMGADWSWDAPAAAYLDVYEAITSAR